MPVWASQPGSFEPCDRKIEGATRVINATLSTMTAATLLASAARTMAPPELPARELKYSDVTGSTPTWSEKIRLIGSRAAARITLARV